MNNSRKSNEDFYSNINIIIFSIAFFINLFWCLVFNEVIILNFWNLDYNTKKRIDERMKIDDALLTGVRETPNLLASLISIRRSPGANSPVMIACRSA